MPMRGLTLLLGLASLLDILHMALGQEGIPAPPQGQEPVTTNGESGVDGCGTSKHRCLSTAVCENDECICNQTGFIGDGRFLCHPESHFSGSIQGDPVLHTLDDLTAHAPYPCRYALTYVSTTHEQGESGGICEYKIFGLNYFVNEGYYVLGVDLEMTLAGNENLDVQKTVAIRVLGVESADEEFEYIEYGKHGPLTRFTAWRGPTTLDYLGIHVGTVLDTVDNFVRLDVPECGLYLAFRAFVRHARQMPGIAIAIEDKNGLVFLDEDTTLLSSPFNFEEPNLIQVKRELNLTKAESALFVALSQGVQQDFGTGALTCMIATKQFTHVCESREWRGFAMKVCSFLYTEKSIASCLLSDMFGESVGSMFSLCTQAICSQWSTLCVDVKETLTMYHCIDIPDYFASLDCYNILDAYNQYIYWLSQ